MKKKVAMALLLGQTIFTAVAHAQNTTQPNKNVSVAITWTDSVPGDFSFTENWDYDYSIYRNQWGQLVKGFSFEDMPCEYYDEFDRLKPDSAAGYYKRYADTTHIPYNFYWENNCHTNWRRDTNRTKSESGDILTIEMRKDTLYLTNLRPTCDCKIRLKIKGDTCYFQSAMYDGELDFLLSQGLSGYFKLDKHAWQDGIIKAEFHMNFRHSKPFKNYYWKGWILAPKIEAKNRK